MKFTKIVVNAGDEVYLKREDGTWLVVEPEMILLNPALTPDIIPCDGDVTIWEA